MPINVVKPKFTLNPATSTIYNSVEEWRAEAERRFGSCPSKWTFMCPVCGHVQKVADFQEFKDQGATLESALKSCLGRYLPVDKHREAFGKRNKPSQPCNYAAWGLFCVCTVFVKYGEDDYQPVFDFAPATEPEKEEPANA